MLYCFHGRNKSEEEIKTGKNHISLLLAAMVALYASHGSAKDADKGSTFVAPGAKLTKVQSGFNGVDGPAADSDGNAYFAKVFESRIHKRTWKDGKATFYSLALADGAAVQAPKGRKITFYTGCRMDNDHFFYDYKTGTPVQNPAPGTYTGVVVVVEE